MRMECGYITTCSWTHSFGRSQVDWNHLFERKSKNKAVLKVEKWGVLNKKCSHIHRYNYMLVHKFMIIDYTYSIYGIYSLGHNFSLLVFCYFIMAIRSQLYENSTSAIEGQRRNSRQFGLVFVIWVLKGKEHPWR
jgi:hypothetical protein